MTDVVLTDADGVVLMVKLKGEYRHVSPNNFRQSLRWTVLA